MVMCTICDDYDKGQISLEASIFALILLFKYLPEEHRHELYWKLYYEAEEDGDWFLLSKLVFHAGVHWGKYEK